MMSSAPDLVDADEMLRVDQRLANYRPATDIAKSCGVCSNYDAGCCGCCVVAGPIRPDYTCDVFETAPPVGPTTVEMSGAYRVAKSNDDQQVVFGWANVAVRKDSTQVLDYHDDIIDPADLEAAAYDFVLMSRASGEDHAGQVDAECVESVVFTVEKARAMGIPDGILPEAGWWLGFYIPDRDAYDRARTSKSMFSIEGTAIREPVTDAEVRR